MAKQNGKVDVKVWYDGSIALVTPQSPAARAWVREHVSEPQYMGPAFAVEPRYLDDLLVGMENDGLLVSV